jgi:proteasome accessory factor B
MRNVIERIINLLAFLLTVGRPVTADEIRSTVAGYAGSSDEAFRRMFERDKELLRGLGVPVVTQPTDRWEVEHGYVIPPGAYRLPDPELTDDERTALWLAAQVVRIGGQPSGPDAILKLGGTRTTGGVEPFAADLGADPDRLADLYVAASERRLVEFTYKGSRRRLAPHGIGHRRGHWYVAGLEGDGERVFRVDRMDSVAVGDTPGAFERRPGLSVAKAMAAHPWETGEGDPVEVRVRFDADAAWWAVRRLGAPAATESYDDGSVSVTLRVTHPDAFLGWVLSFGASAVIESPPELRRALVARVEAVTA